MPARALDSRQIAQFAQIAFALLVVAFAAWSVRSSDAGREHGVREVGVAEARRLIDAGALVLDVRESAKAQAAHLPRALLIPLEDLATRLGELGKDLERPIVVYCGQGTERGPRAVALLNRAGFADAVSLRDGFEGWRAAGMVTVSR